MTEPEQPVAVPLRAALEHLWMVRAEDDGRTPVSQSRKMNAALDAVERAALAVEAVRPETTLTPEALDEWYEQTRPEPAVRPETDPLNEMIGVGQYEVHSPDDGHDHVTDGDGSIIAIRPDTDIDEERLALALWAHDEKQSPYPSVQQAPDDYHRKLARNIAAIYRATPLAERPE